MTQDPRIRELFLKLWDKAVGTPTYDKKQWIDMQRMLENDRRKQDRRKTQERRKRVTPTK
jgi:hypothetical protein